VKKIPLFLIAMAVLAASCNLPSVKDTETPASGSGKTDSSSAGTSAGDGGKTGEALVFLPTEKPAETEAKTETENPQLPDAVPEFAQADYPEQRPDAGVFGLPEPREPAIPEQRPEPAQTPPPEPPPPPPPPPQETAPQEKPPQRETPPPVPPALVRPSEPPPPPPPEREDPSPVIPDMPFEPATIIPGPAENDLPYSRTVRAWTGQYIEIPFRGPGWVYLGEFGSRRGVSYDSRRMESEGMTFIFRADTEGTYSLKFTRQDFVRDYILNDYVKVIVEEHPAVTGTSWSNAQVRPERVYATPRWPLPTDPQGNVRMPEEQNNQAAAPTTPASTPPAAPPAAPAGGNTAGQNTAGQNAGTQTNQNTGTAAQPPSSTASTPATPQPPSIPPASQPPANQPPASQPPASTPDTPAAAANTANSTAGDDWLKKARDEYNAGRIANALWNLDQFMIRFPGGSDEAFWLYGQSLEANNESTRDIRLALDYYRRLVREFPQSSRHDEARRRIVYLERFYFNIQ